MKLFHTRYSGLIRQPSPKWAGLLTLGLVLLLVLSGTSLQARAADTAGFSDSVAKLVTDDFDEKEAVIAELTKTDHPQLLNTFRYLLAGELYYQKSDKHVVYAKATDKGYQTYDVVTGEKLQIVDKFDLHKIGINNKMRNMLGTIRLTNPVCCSNNGVHLGRPLRTHYGPEAKRGVRCHRYWY